MPFSEAYRTTRRQNYSRSVNDWITRGLVTHRQRFF